MTPIVENQVEKKLRKKIEAGLGLVFYRGLLGGLLDLLSPLNIRGLKRWDDGR